MTRSAGKIKWWSKRGSGVGGGGIDALGRKIEQYECRGLRIGSASYFSVRFLFSFFVGDSGSVEVNGEMVLKMQCT